MKRDPELWHVRTDPICILYRTPRTQWGRWRHDRARGRACLRCLRDPLRVRRIAVGGVVLEVMDTHAALTQEQADRVARAWFEAHGMLDATPCPTCSGPIRETTNGVCQTCGKDWMA